MPVTIRPQPERVGRNRLQSVHSSADLLAQTSKAWCTSKSADHWTQTNKRTGPETRQVLRHSFTDLDQQPPRPPAAAAGPPGAWNPAEVPSPPATTLPAAAPGLVPLGNGFIEGVIRAFQQDLHLVLRPDDVWLACLVQFSFFVNGHAEALRGTFVAHAGQETLVVDVTPSSVRDVDVGAFARAMADVMEGVLVEPGVRDWLLPGFSTSTAADRSVAAMVMMGTMKAYFEYVMMCGCGFPSVRLEGERADWEDLRERVRRFARYGAEPAEWSRYLVTVLDCMVKSFHRPEDGDVKDFWMRACHHDGAEGSGQGIASLSGWITAFCFWDEDGKRVPEYSDEELLAAAWGGKDNRGRLVLDDVVFPIIRQKAIPKAVADVPVKVVDLETRMLLDTTLIAGSVGMVASRSGGVQGEGADTFQPRSGWWMLLDKAEPME